MASALVLMIAIPVGTVVASGVGVSALKSIAGMRLDRYFKYKMRKRKANNWIKKGTKVGNLNFDLFKNGMKALKRIDYDFELDKYQQYMIKHNLNEDIMEDRELFLMRFDINALTEKLKGSGQNSKDELNITIKNIEERENMLTDNDNLHKIQKMEQWETELKELEREVNKKLRVHSML